MWNLYGKQYDLTEFAKRHPGGEEIITNTRGLADCTALFESYHAFSDLSGILQSLNKYEVRTENSLSQPKTDDFSNYRELTQRIKQHYPNRAAIKATHYWQICTSGIGALYCFLLWAIFNSDYTLIKCLVAFFGGIVEMSLLFNVLHDSSHYAISLNADTNTRVSKLVNGWALWNHIIWFYQHVYYHHSFTGGNRDTDGELYKFTATINHLPAWQFEMLTNFTYAIFPGQHVSQIVWYFYNALANQIQFVNKPSFFIPANYETSSTIRSIVRNANKNFNTYSVFAMIAKLWLLRSMGWQSGCLYLIGVNATYYINIMADHDLFETHENHYDGPDWAKRQICNSGNFATDCSFWTIMFGGINHQIEHHLFPNICNQHYPEIARIVRQFCKEKGFPYSCQPTVFDAYKSVMKKMKSL